MKIVNPATEQIIEELNEDDLQSVQEKFIKLKNGQKKWAQKSVHDRLECLKKFSSFLADQDNIKALALDLSMEVGKPLKEAENEVKGAVKRMQFFLTDSLEFLKKEFIQKDNTVEEYIDFSPLGVIANISAWNYPFLVGINVFVPALLTGNAVLYKPSEYALKTGRNIEKLLHQSGIPEDVFSMVVGDGEIGQKILELDIDGVFFTGSYKTGKAIAVEVASKLIPVGLELGGKDPMYVTEEISDISRVAQAAVEGAFYNNGQSCCSVERIYVHENVYDSFIENFVKYTQQLKVGDPMDSNVQQGPLTRKDQLDFLENQVKDAVSKGAKVLCGGERIKGEGYFFSPTVLVNVNHDMLVMKEESFGPIIGIEKVSSDEQAISLMNDTDYGLTCSVYTDNIERGQAVLDQIDSGTGYLNCCDRVSSYLPWAGRKNSGMGLTLSKYGLLPFIQTKSLHYNI
ncbi:MAG: aldehyde dehydrogenase family protein [Bacteriovoracaceae bacterium]